tara:strand:+ start:158 stop:487 length:330 start_codon:yes stop_codon:yes gene_type:complete
MDKTTKLFIRVACGIIIFTGITITAPYLIEFIKDKTWYWQTGKELKQQCLKLEEEYKNREYIEYDLKRGDLDPNQFDVQQTVISLCWTDYENKDKPFYNYQDFIKSESK